MKSIEKKEDLQSIKLPLSQEDYQALDDCPIDWMEWPKELRYAYQEMADAKALEKWGEA
ncbi:MAG: hypothetical protein IKM71_07485 [Bacteroidaceae bacterium]|nr:hypothetical protein [Bacteroidaceae bacterium]